MTTDPAVRTRVLYAWEQDDLNRRRGVRDIRTHYARNVTLASMWCHLGGALLRKPCLIYEADNHYCYCEGRTLISLADCNKCNLVILHEITHALGYGSISNPHGPGFVRSYITNMAAWFRWEIGELLMQAKLRKLL